LLFSLFSVIAVADGALSQQPAATIVSPAAATAAEGADENNFPFNDNTIAPGGARRYMQLHGDLGGFKIITRLAFRQNASTVNFTGTRTIDLEMFMGSGRFVELASFVFAQNYIGTPIRTIARKIINMGPQGQAVSPGPNSFNANMFLVLDAPFAYSGSTALAWEVVVYSSALMGGSFNFMDADQSSGTTAATAITGVGCTATGRAAPMTHIATYRDQGGILLANFTVTNGPSNAPTLLSMGNTNPNAAFPGFCSNIYDNATVIFLIGVTNGAGSIATDHAGSATFVFPNTVAGATLFTQAHSLDPGRPNPVKVSNSNGRSGVVPARNTMKVVNVARIFNNVGGTTAIEGVFFADLTIGYGLVTQFTF
jgi:hypothetical protein